MNTPTLIVLLLLLLVLLPALKGTLTHLKGEGVCCGGPREKARQKMIKGQKKTEHLLHVEGMHCRNCQIRIENCLNEEDGVLAQVNLHRKTVRISLYKEVPLKELIDLITELGYTVRC